jgi:hypothetical protein
MMEQRTHEVEIVAPSIDELKAVLEVVGDLSEGMQTALAEGTTLTVSEVSKSSGFDATTVILTGMVSVAVSTSSALLTEWLKSKLLKRKDEKPAAKTVTILVDGKKIEIS